MFWLNILDSEIIHVVVETSAIVIGSILMGILLAYLHWGGYKKRVAHLNHQLEFEKNQIADLKIQLNELSSIRTHLISEISSEINKNNIQSKSIYDQQQQLANYETKLNEYKSIIDQMNATIETYQHRLKIIEEELLQPKEQPVPAKRPNPVQLTRANYDHVSKLLGRQVTENDLTLIWGIGPRTAFLLEAAGIDTWDNLAKTPVEYLRQILTDAGGIYKSLDPTHWPKQAIMAAQSEWRKLRVFQESLKKVE